VFTMVLLSVAMAFAIFYKEPRELFLALLKTVRAFGKRE